MVGTLFHGTRVPLQKWFLAVGLFMREEKDPTVRELASVLKVNKTTANGMTARIRGALIEEISLLVAVSVEVMKGDNG